MAPSPQLAHAWPSQLVRLLVSQRRRHRLGRGCGGVRWGRGWRAQMFSVFALVLPAVLSKSKTPPTRTPNAQFPHFRYHFIRPLSRRCFQKKKKKDLCLIHCVWLRTRGRKQEISLRRAAGVNRFFIFYFFFFAIVKFPPEGFSGAFHIGEDRQNVIGLGIGRAGRGGSSLIDLQPLSSIDTLLLSVSEDLPPC